MSTATNVPELLSAAETALSRAARTAAEIARGLSLKVLAGPFLELILVRWERAIDAGSPQVINAA